MKCIDCEDSTKYKCKCFTNGLGSKYSYAAGCSWAYLPMDG